MTSNTPENAERTVSDPRQPHASEASGTASAADTAAPKLIPVAYTPVANAGRSGQPSFTARGMSVPATATPIPTGTVSTITNATEGTSARATPKTPIRANAIEIDAREPIRFARTTLTG